MAGLHCQSPCGAGVCHGNFQIQIPLARLRLLSHHSQTAQHMCQLKIRTPTHLCAKQKERNKNSWSRSSLHVYQLDFNKQYAFTLPNTVLQLDLGRLCWRTHPVSVWVFPAHLLQQSVQHGHRPNHFQACCGGGKDRTKGQVDHLIQQQGTIGG